MKKLIILIVIVAILGVYYFYEEKQICKYDNQNNLIEYQSDQGVLKFSYYDNNTIATVISPDNIMLSFKYNSFAKPTKIEVKGLGILYTNYDNNGEITKIYATDLKGHIINSHSLNKEITKVISFTTESSMVCEK